MEFILGMVVAFVVSLFIGLTIRPQNVGVLNVIESEEGSNLYIVLDEDPKHLRRKKRVAMYVTHKKQGL